jgi:K+-sensing histidine kinase KdpD
MKKSIDLEKGIAVAGISPLFAKESNLDEYRTDSSQPSPLVTSKKVRHQTRVFLGVMGGQKIYFPVKRSKLLQQKVEERTRQLAELNRVKELLITVILHDLRSPLRFLHILASSLYSKYKTATDNELVQMLSQFQNATNTVYDFIKDFFVFTNLQKEGFVINRERIVLRQLVNTIVSFFEVGARIQKNTFMNLVPDHIILDTDAGLLSLILRNLADNANKHTSGGIITINATQEADAIRIMVKDTGESMNKELVTRILNKNYDPGKQEMGWGYKIIIETLTRLQGTLDIVSDNGHGNTITIGFENKGQV